MQPLFAEGRYYEGLDKGLDALMQLAKGEISEKDLPGSQGKRCYSYCSNYIGYFNFKLDIQKK
ncbi:MAG: hypothetical protein KatS3mg027_1784 [Bacteroidia bacterium]|nr:MAG: hypothetical protein KatS3mg027_1784 [Bacteroidia bacterium]